MIPTYLSVRNFMCYREPVELDLRGIRVACLSGDNGAGKSALLDSITWALWGKARVNSDRDLLALGETEMEVTFGFLLNDQEFRVTRRRTRRGAGPLMLELQIRDGDAWRSLSGATVRETQQAIDNLLRIDYDTFINSAFILQGRADEFTTRTPANRKQVLGEILNLSDYDRFEELARRELRRREQQLHDLEADLVEIDGRLAELPRHEAEVEALSQELLALGDQAEALGERLAATQARLQELEFTAQQLRDTRSRLGALDADLERLEREREATAARIARWRAVIARRAQIEADHAEWRRLQAESEALAQRLAERQELLERRQEVERAIEQEVHRLQTQIHSLRCQIEEREVLLRDKEAAEREVATVRAKLAALDAIDAEIAALRQAQTEREAERGAIEAENRRLREDMDQIKARLDQVRSAEAICPVCRRDLGPAERARLEAEYVDEGTALGDRFRANKARAKEIEAEAARDADRLGALERRRRELETMARREAALAERLDRIAKAEGEAEVLRGVLEGLEQSLASGRTVAEHRARLAEIDQALAQLPYSREEHQAIRARLAGLAGVEQERRDLDAAVAALESDERQAASLAESIAARQEERAALCQQEAALAARVADLAPIQRERDTLQAEFDAVTRRKGEAQERFGAAQQRLADCLALRDRRDELVAERARVVEEQAIYDELALAFGKRGIQAMIIENIVPELEHEANAILDKMPGNTMRVEFRTQRQAVSTDGMIETLDIIISDEAGRRPYELYSGGEAFRINFAIRVALSTLLARRAGTRLQTLVIDEGFGTQDVRGRDGLVEAINAVQDEFRMILVITHIQELKEVFPNRIDVVKTPDGSRVHLN